MTVGKSPTVPVFRYIPRSRSKDGESPFSECTARKIISKPISKCKGTDWQVLKDKGVLLYHKASHSKVTGAPLPSIIVFSKGSL